MEFIRRQNEVVDASEQTKAFFSLSARCAFILDFFREI